MIKPGNSGVLMGGVVADPEVINDKIVKMRLAADYAGSDRQNPDNKTGYFNLVSFEQRIMDMVNKGHIKKGSQILVSYALRDERWETADGKKASGTVLVVENFDFVGSKNSESPSTTTATATVPTSF